MSVSFIQEVAKDATTGSTATPAATLTATPTAGNRLIARIAANGTVSSVTDSKGNTWTLDVSQTTASPYWALASCVPTTALVTGDVVTAHLSGATSIHGIVIDEWSNVAAFGASTAIVGGTTTTRTTNAITVPGGALVLGAWTTTSVDSSFSPGSGYTGFHTANLTLSGGASAMEGEYQIDSGSGGTYTPTATGSSATQRGESAYYIAAGTVPVNSVAPTISGANTDGSTLTSATGTWSNSPTSYAYQWTRDGTNISGATTSTYVLTLADRSHVLRCAVTATNGSGSSGAVTSSNSITATAPTVTAAGKLKYAPPTQNSPTTIDLTAAPGDYFATWTSGVDYIINLSPTVQRTGEIEVDANGARSVKIIGGVWALNDGGTKNYHIHIHNLMGWAFVEGQEADMANTHADFCDISGGALYTPDVYFQNSRIINLTATDSTNHADIFQPQGLVGRVYVDKLTFSSNYQGFTISAGSTGNQPSKAFTLSRVNSWFSSANLTNQYTYHYWINNANGTAGNDTDPFPLTFDDVWCDLTRGYGRSYYDGLISRVVYPSADVGTSAGGGSLGTGNGPSPFANGEVIGSQDSTDHSYCIVPNPKMKVGGKLQSGSPSTGRSDVVTDIDGSGSFVPAGIGANYTTPGYLPRPRVGVAI
jgi:hypothetical protein